MKKILLSLAVIAASGAYVVVENHAVDQSSTDSAALSLSPAALPEGKAGVQMGALLPAATPDAIPLPAQPATAQVSIATKTARLQPAPVPAASTENNRASIDVAEIAPARLPPTASDAAPVPLLPALPRPRPASAPQAPVAQAAPQAPQADPQLAQASASASTQGGQFRDGTFKGSSANAYYGRVQVSAVVRGGQLVAVNVLQYPNDRRTSRYINGQALPMLKREAVQAQSARVDTVSGATLTSNAYRQSLAAALSAAGGGNA